MASTLRSAVLWALKLEIPWTAQDMADMAGTELPATKAYLAQLERRGVIQALGGDAMRAGRPEHVDAFRREAPNAKLGGGGKAYRKAKLVRDRLLIAEAAARRGGTLLPGHMPAHPGAPEHIAVSADGLLRLGLGSELLGVSTWTLRRWEKRGHVRLVQLPSGQFRIPAAEIGRLLDLRQSPLRAALTG